MSKHILTKREKELIELLILGKTNNEIAKDMIVSVHTIKAMLEKLYIKYNVHNKMQLGVKYIKQVYFR